MPEGHLKITDMSHTAHSSPLSISHSLSIPMLFLSSGGPGGLHGNLDSCESVSGVQTSTERERVVNVKRTKTNQKEKGQVMNTQVIEKDRGA